MEDLSFSVSNYMSKIMDTIESHGWAVQGVVPTEDDTDPVPFAYTVGLTGYGHPELIVCGVDPMNVGIVLLNDLGEQVKSGRAFSHGEVPRHLLAGGFDPILINVTDLSRLAIARRIYGESVTALQLLLPDKRNRLPWHTGYDMDWQPVLGPGIVQGNV